MAIIIPARDRFVIRSSLRSPRDHLPQAMNRSLPALAATSDWFPARADVYGRDRRKQGTPAAMERR
jgi:hypothetical protein